jgi:hypothetical protein
MSSITANVSLREIEANTHSHPKRMRQYKKVSHSNLDNTSVEAYLRSQKFLRTLVVFQEEVKTERSCYLFLKVLSLKFRCGSRGLLATQEKYRNCGRK